MSCFLVNDYHLSVLVGWAVLRQVSYFTPGDRTWHKIDADAAPGVAALLRAANVAAFRGRYPSAEVAPRYEYRAVAVGIFPPVRILRAVDCLDYQCSDWTGWRDSEARRALRAIREAAIAALPGYAAGGWELAP